MMGKNGLDRRRAAIFLLLLTAAAAVWVALSRSTGTGVDRDPLAAAAGPWRSRLFETGGRAALAAGDAAGALDQFETAAALAPLTAAGHLAVGDAERLLGEWEAAIPEWTAAGELGADPAAVAYRLLEAHQALRDYSAAVADLQTLTTLEPDNAALHYRLGLLLAAQQPEIALAALTEAAALDENLAAAVALLQQGLTPDPEVDDPAFVYFNVGRALASLSEWDLAAEAFRSAVLANPQYAEAWAFLGEAYYRLGADGSEMMATALELEPESLAVNMLKALQLRREGRPADALPYLARAELAAPGTPAVAAETAQAYAEMGDINQALDYFIRAVDLAPDDPTYLHLLAAFSIYNEIQVDEVGLPAARNAVLADEADFTALDQIGYAYYSRGDWVSGLRFLLRTLDANPGYAPARLHLGMLYLARDDQADARQQLELAVELAPGSPAALQAQDILDAYLP